MMFSLYVQKGNQGAGQNRVRLGTYRVLTCCIEKNNIKRNQNANIQKITTDVNENLCISLFYLT